MDSERQIIFYKTYFQDFYLDQNEKVREKIACIFKVINSVQKIPAKFSKHLEGTDGLFEIRIEFESNIYRVFCCFDKGNLVVLFNAFQKKTQKTPKNEIELAIKLKKEYFNSKN
ncbi:type II toxin-antitoxin system RelE/ParE family toxin [Flavobacterium sp.]|uniref:type II toxin-antitoxin system RelE/ParE family toxin n=1 Tax=Flavobacterium sp. TaxID=239 RepID=UPI002B4B179C|nr:type II toxin-antitoxin system RelE/ParE family toxin [Flavobacterium sp.]